MPIMSHNPVRQTKKTPFVRLADKGFCKSLVYLKRLGELTGEMQSYSSKQRAFTLSIHHYKIICFFQVYFVDNLLFMKYNSFKFDSNF
jgi:hypothetical protein